MQAFLDEVDVKGWCMIHYACNCGHTFAVKAILTAIPEEAEKVVDKRTNRAAGFTPLMMFCDAELKATADGMSEEIAKVMFFMLNNMNPDLVTKQSPIVPRLNKKYRMPGYESQPEWTQSGGKNFCHMLCQTKEKTQLLRDLMIFLAEQEPDSPLFQNLHDCEHKPV